MGVGKTTIGKKLASALGVNFVDTDQIVTKEHGPIPEIFETHGEGHFRMLEQKALITALSSPCVVATGGGVVTSEENRMLMQAGTVVYLATDGKHMRSRLTTGSRPLLKQGMVDWQRIYRERKPLYQECADFTIDTSSKPLKAILAEVIDMLEARNV